MRVIAVLGFEWEGRFGQRESLKGITIIVSVFQISTAILLNLSRELFHRRLAARRLLCRV